MIDIDELMFPSTESTVNNTISSFLSLQESSIAAIAIDRFIAPANPLLSSKSSSISSTKAEQGRTKTQSPSLMLDKIETLFTPQEIDRHDNTKMIYRTSALKLAWVHWEVAFRSDQPSQLKKKIDKMDDGIMIVHVSKSKGRGPFETAFTVGERMKEHVEKVREGYRNMFARLPWLAL